MLKFSFDTVVLRENLFSLFSLCVSVVHCSKTSRYCVALEVCYKF